jgi:hypothetical protein
VQNSHWASKIFQKTMMLSRREYKMIGINRGNRKGSVSSKFLFVACGFAVAVLFDLLGVTAGLYTFILSLLSHFSLVLFAIFSKVGYLLLNIIIFLRAGRIGPWLAKKNPSIINIFNELKNADPEPPKPSAQAVATSPRNPDNELLAQIITNSEWSYPVLPLPAQSSPAIESAASILDKPWTLCKLPILLAIACIIEFIGSPIGAVIALYGIVPLSPLIFAGSVVRFTGAMGMWNMRKRAVYAYGIGIAIILFLEFCIAQSILALLIELLIPSFVFFVGRHYLCQLPYPTTQGQIYQQCDQQEESDESKQRFSKLKTKILIPIIIAIASATVFLVGYHILTYEPAPAPGQILRVHEDLERIIRLSGKGYSGMVTVQGIIAGSIGGDSDMLHIEITTDRNDLKILGNNIQFYVRMSKAAYLKTRKQWDFNWRGKTMKVAGTLEASGGWVYGIIVDDDATVEIE